MSDDADDLTWYTIVNLTRVDVADARTRADRLGLSVKRGRLPGVHGVDKTGSNGPFRCFGLVEFNRDLKRWGVVSRSDATAAEIATLIEFAIRRLREFGTDDVPPMTDKTWSHVLGKDGHEYDFTRLGRQVDENGASDVVSSEQLADMVNEFLSLTFAPDEVDA